jgi:hypothetical protein
MGQIKTLFITVIFFSIFHLFVVNAQDIQDDYSTPLAAFQTYLRACKNRDFLAVDKCYSEEFNRFTKSNQQYISHRHVGQLDNEYNTCANKSARVDLHGKKAIIRLYPEDKKTPPFFMIKENGQWKIDGMFMFKNIIYDQNDEWFWKDRSKDNERVWAGS